MRSHSRSSSVASYRSVASSSEDCGQPRDSDDASCESLSDSEASIGIATTIPTRARPKSYWIIELRENETDREIICRPFERVIGGDEITFVNSRFSSETHETLVNRFADAVSDAIPDDMIEQDSDPIRNLAHRMSLCGLYEGLTVDFGSLKVEAGEKSVVTALRVTVSGAV